MKRAAASDDAGGLALKPRLGGKTWRCALVGGGRLGQYYADAYRTFDDTELVALMEPNAERGAAVAKKFGIAAHYTDLERMLEEAKPDIVTIATPGSYFKQTVLAAVRAGVRAVQVEKPFGGPLADADEMAAACDAAGIVFAGGALSRAYPQVQEAAARLQVEIYNNLQLLVFFISSVLLFMLFCCSYV